MAVKLFETEIECFITMTGNDVAWFGIYDRGLGGVSNPFKTFKAYRMIKKLKRL